MVTYRVFRFDPSCDEKHRFDEFTFEEKRGMTVLEGLIHIQEKLDPSLAFRSSCRSALCGSCAMHIGGRFGLACQTQLSKAVVNGKLTIRPLGNMPVIRDLVVNLKEFFAQWKAMRPFLVPRAAAEGGREYLQTPQQRRKLHKIADCIMCGSCFGSCPSVARQSGYVGPHALMRALRYIEDSRDSAAEERLQMVADEKGVYRCHSAFNCQSVCPKKLDPASAVAELKRKIVFARGSGS
jgi:succinate dehydrogenase / fumarate reductase iron-sulfur subunit